MIFNEGSNEQITNQHQTTKISESIIKIKSHLNTSSEIKSEMICDTNKIDWVNAAISSVWYTVVAYWIMNSSILKRFKKKEYK